MNLDLLQTGARLVEFELCVALFQPANDLPFLDKVTDFHGRGGHASADGRRNIGRFLGDK